MRQLRKALQYSLISVGGILVVFIIISFFIKEPEFYTRPGRLFYTIIFLTSFIGEYLRLYFKNKDL